MSRWCLFVLRDKTRKLKERNVRKWAISCTNEKAAVARVPAAALVNDGFLVGVRSCYDRSNNASCDGREDEVAVYLTPFVAPGRPPEVVCAPIIDAAGALPILVAHVGATSPLTVTNVPVVITVAVIVPVIRVAVVVLAVIRVAVIVVVVVMLGEGHDGRRADAEKHQSGYSFFEQDISLLTVRRTA